MSAVHQHTFCTFPARMRAHMYVYVCVCVSVSVSVTLCVSLYVVFCLLLLFLSGVCSLVCLCLCYLSFLHLCASHLSSTLMMSLLLGLGLQATTFKETKA